MSVEWLKADEEVIELAKRLIEQYHPRLQSARIGILFRSEAPRSGGRVTLGKASKVDAKWKPLLNEPLDFVIWLAMDWWENELDYKQQKALLDHELQHCMLDEHLNPQLRTHDVEEFSIIIQRHGLWKEDLQVMGDIVKQLDMPFREPGFVKAIQTGKVKVQ